MTDEADEATVELHTIKNPWLVVFQPQGQTLRSLFFGPKEATLQNFAIIAALVIQNIARAYGVPQEEVERLVKEELDKPTTMHLGTERNKSRLN